MKTLTKREQKWVACKIEEILLLMGAHGRGHLWALPIGDERHLLVSLPCEFPGSYQFKMTAQPDPFKDAALDGTSSFSSVYYDARDVMAFIMSRLRGRWHEDGEESANRRWTVGLDNLRSEIV